MSICIRRPKYLLLGDLSICLLEPKQLVLGDLSKISGELICTILESNFFRRHIVFDAKFEGYLS